MNTEPSREAAKSGIARQDQSDPEFTAVFGEAKDEAVILRAKIAEYSHMREMASINRGQVGKLLGSRSEKAGNIACIVILVCFVLIVMAFYKMDLDKQFDSFLKFVGGITSIITASLGYLFGSAKK